MRSSQTAGLGSATSFSHSLDNVQDVKRTSRWLKANERFHGKPGGTNGNRGDMSKKTGMTFVQGATLAPSGNKLESEDTQ